MDSAGIGNWGVFGQLVTVVAAALAAVYIILDNVRRTTNENKESPIELPTAVTVFYPPRRGGIFGRAFQRGRPYFGSRSPLRSIWELGTERPLVTQEAKSCQNRVTEIAGRLEELSASCSSDDSADSPSNMEPVWFGGYRHDDESISPAPDRYLSDTAEETWGAMESHGSDVGRVSDRCVEDSHSRLQRLLQRDMERQAKVRTYQLWTRDGEKIKETVKLGKEWLKDVDKDLEKFNVEVCIERDDRMPAIPERNGLASAKLSVEVSSTAPCCTVHEINISNRYTPTRSFTRKPSGARTKYQEFSMPPPKQDEDEEDCRQIPLLSNGDEPCLRAVDDTVSRKKDVDLTETVKDTSPNFKIASVVAWETPKRQNAQTIISPNGIHPDVQCGGATRSSKKDENKDRTSKPPIPPSSLPLTQQQLDSSKALFKARQQFFENLSRQNEAISPDCVTKFKRFQQSARQDRYRLATSTPDLKILEETVRTSFPRPVPVAEVPVERRQPPPPPPRAWPHHPHLNKKTRKYSKSVGYLETDVDTMQSRTVLETTFGQPDRVQSMLTLRRKNRETETEASRARSVDQLTPEPQATQMGRTKSEYEIRVEKSLQNLSVPEWYRQSKWSHSNKDGFILKKKRGERSWQEVRSRKATLSMTNLNRGHGEMKRGLRSADESPTSSTGSLSRWSSAKLSTASGPVFSWSGTYRTGRQPYLGWRASLTQSPTSSNQSIGSTPTSPDPGSCESSSKKILKYLGQDVQAVGSLEDVTEVTDKCEMLEEDPKSPGSHSDHLSIPRDRYSYMESIFNSDSCIPKRSAQINLRDDPSKVVWIESSFVGSRATTSVAVMPDVGKKSSPVHNGTDTKSNKSFHF